MVNIIVKKLRNAKDEYAPPTLRLQCKVAVDACWLTFQTSHPFLNTHATQIHVPARSVIIGIGAVPNSELFRGKLEMSEVSTEGGGSDRWFSYDDVASTVADWIVFGIDFIASVWDLIHRMCCSGCGIDWR